MMRQVTIPHTDDMSDDNSKCQPDQQVEHRAVCILAYPSKPFSSGVSRHKERIF